MKGHSDIVKYCINHCSIPRDVFYYNFERDIHYAIGRHWRVMKLLKKHRFWVDWGYCCYKAAKTKNTEPAMQIINNCKFSDICAIAVGENDLETLKWARE